MIINLKDQVHLLHFTNENAASENIELPLCILILNSLNPEYIFLE